MVRLWHCLLLAVFLRLLLLLYGDWQDQVMDVKYTDVDYHVFTDAARFITQGQSPYRRATYRYTPFLAMMVTPNIYVHPHCGKLLFILCDVLAGYILYHILLRQSYTITTSLVCACLWLFNPMAATVSSRGNAESVMAVLVLNTLYLLQRKQHKLAACVYGASVHMKIYPVTYALPIYLFLEGVKDSKNQASNLTVLMKKLIPNRCRLEFVIVSVSVFIGLTSMCYLRYGDEFLHETYLYHVTRRDVRHNFSVYFYMLYVTAQTKYSSIIGLAAFIPQVALLVVYSFQNYRDLPYCFFLNTFVFVTFNKVVTSQYFLWYLCILPLVIPSLMHIGVLQTVAMVTSWVLSQALWLSVAYRLEFQGQDVLLQLWICSVVFLVVNIAILFRITQCYRCSNDFARKLVKSK